MVVVGSIVGLAEICTCVRILNSVKSKWGTVEELCDAEVWTSAGRRQSRIVVARTNGVGA